ncbi:hypothetical protein H696_02407 [Fonticula alba]|uniref:Uncharacterized protein n=1 Tax=Fonticula alba TaxID=691883 RepID=A0A058ZC07_FONAL|nr:hypothetical protein H696_02407 [Fonticula alba]KCV71461.1 hypothetical protein H696_02407 [Fonticula alba]|eukprot:XP_009494584.1 hypothetical protein H696_02407 [Fonticula alba]
MFPRPRSPQDHNQTHLLDDPPLRPIPNSIRTTSTRASASLKTCKFVGELGTSVATGSSDGTIGLWHTDTLRPIAQLTGHTSRVWDLCSTRDGVALASCSSDGTVKT